MGHQWPRPQTSPARTGSPSSPHETKRIVVPWSPLSPLAYQVDHRKESDRRTITHGASIGWMAHNGPIFFEDLFVCLANWHPFARTSLNRSWWKIPRSIATFFTWVFRMKQQTHSKKQHLAAPGRSLDELIVAIETVQTNNWYIEKHWSQTWMALTCKLQPPCLFILLC